MNLVKNAMGNKIFADSLMELFVVVLVALKKQYVFFEKTKSLMCSH